MAFAWGLWVVKQSANFLFQICVLETYFKQERRETCTRSKGETRRRVASRAARSCALSVYYVR